MDNFILRIVNWLPCRHYVYHVIPTISIFLEFSNSAVNLTFNLLSALNSSTVISLVLYNKLYYCYYYHH